MDTLLRFGLIVSLSIGSFTLMISFEDSFGESYWHPYYVMTIHDQNNTKQDTFIVSYNIQGGKVNSFFMEGGYLNATVSSKSKGILEIQIPRNYMVGSQSKSRIYAI